MSAIIQELEKHCKEYVCLQSLAKRKKIMDRKDFRLRGLSDRTKRYEYHLTAEDIETLAWLCKEEIKVQELLIDESDGVLLKQLLELYDCFTW